MSLRFKKLLTNILFLILPVCLFSLLGTKAYAENSYIIVHALNPESVEIASIQGMSQNSVEIYDGNTLIGYGAYNAETHNKPIALSSGTHTIRVKFNGVTKEETITLSHDETKVLTFSFDRTEFNIVGYLDSMKLDCTFSVNQNYSIYPNLEIENIFIPKDIHKDLIGRLHIAGSTVKNGNSVSVNVNVQYYIDGRNYRSRIYNQGQLSGDLKQSTWVNIAAYVCSGSDSTGRNCGSQPEDGTKWPDVAIIPAQSFENWFVQSHNYVHYYPGLIFARKETPEVYQYVMTTNDTLAKLPAAYAYRKAIWGQTGTGTFVQLKQSQPYGVEDGDLPDGSVDWFMSSVPYDFIGTGIKDEEIIKIPLGKKDFPCTDNEKTYRIYVPSRYGGTLTVTTDAGVIELFYPNSSTKIAGPTAKIDYSVPLDKHGWYYVKYSGAASCKIFNTFLEEGEASYRPWNFWYYPFAKQDNPAKNLYGEEGPLAKYDAAFGTDARSYEMLHYSSGLGWEGHCLGGSIASILVPQPQSVTYAGQLFNQEEVEGLVTKLANTYNTTDLVRVSKVPSWRREIDGSITPIRPIPGVDETDKFVNRFHRGLLNSLRNPQGSAPLYSNLRQSTGIDPKQVWNHAVYKYSSFLEEADEGNENIIKFTTSTFANSDMFPSNIDVDRIDVYTYKLKYTMFGDIDNGFSGADWIGATGFAPEQLISIFTCAFDNDQKHNPDLNKENIEEKLGVRLSR